MALTLKESEKFDVIPEGVLLEAEVVKAQVKDSIWWVDPDDHSKGKQREVSFRFVITDDQEFVNEDGETITFRGRNLFGSTPTTFSNNPNCKLRIWVQELFSTDDLPVGFELEEENDGTLPGLEGLSVKVVVGHWQKKNADGSTSPKEKVVDVMRIGGYADASQTFG